MQISFKKMKSKEDVELFCKWVQEPHVNEFWRLTYKEARDKIMPRIKSDSLVKVFFILFDNKPIGYIQYYDAVKADKFWKDELPGTYGVDLFIGEKDYINKGYGTKIVREFCSFLFNSETDCIRIIVDPYVRNKRAIRCYEKAGFVFVSERKNEDGKDIFIMEMFKN